MKYYFIALIVLMAGLAAAYDITELPFQTTGLFEFNESIGQNISLSCLRIIDGDVETDCFFTSVDKPTFVSPDNLTFLISVPNIYHNEFSTEYWTYTSSDNSTGPITAFEINIVLPPPPPPVSNVSVNVSPVNGRLFGQYDALPSSVIVDLGNVDINKSDISLLYNGGTSGFINKTVVGGRVIFNLSRIFDGVYSGRWLLYDFLNGSAYEYNYSFEIRTAAPAQGSLVSPSKGRYTSESSDIIFYQPGSGNFSVSIIVNDGYPTTGGSWIPLTREGDQYIYRNYKFSDAGVGALYVKVIDEFGNLKIQPTGVVSAPFMGLSFSDRTVEGGPDTESDLYVKVTSKKGSGNLLRCRMKDFVSEGRGQRRIMPTKNNVIMSDDVERVYLGPDYDQTLKMGDTTSKEYRLSVYVPANTVTGLDYASNLECLLTKG